MFTLQEKGLLHPQRPSGSQSGWEKKRDKSFQARAEEPLSTESHQTISKRSSECWLLIGHKKCFVIWCPIGEQFPLSSFREFVPDGFSPTCPVRSPRLFLQGKLSFSTFLTRNEGTTNESKKRLACYQQDQFNLHRKVKKAIRLDMAKQDQKNITLFCTFLCRHCTTTPRENA